MSSLDEQGTEPVRERAARGASWTLPMALVSRAIGLLGTLALAHFLAPVEFGEVSAALVVVTTATSVTTFGVGQYLIAHRDISRADVFHVSSFFLVTGVGVIIGTWLLAKPMEAWLGASQLSHFMPILLATMVMERVAYVPEKVLVRGLRFRMLSIARAAGEIVYTVVSLLLAREGFGGIALVWGCLARTSLRCGLLLSAVSWREWLTPSRLSVASTVRIVKYGLKVSASGVATFGMRRWDNLLITRYFGPEILGSYNYAYNLADTPAVAIGEQLGDVIGASLPHVKAGGRQAAMLRSCGLLAVVMFPLAFGLVVVAPMLVRTVLNAQWRNVGSMLAILAVISAARPIGDVFESYLYATHHPRAVMALEWFGLASVIGVLTTLGRIGFLWACIGVSLAFVVRAVAAVLVVSVLDRTPMLRLLAPVMGPLAASAVMVAAVIAAGSVATAGPLAAQLAIQVAVGAVVYAAAAQMFARPAVRELVALATSVVLGRPVS